MSKRTCSIPNCARVVHGHGWCSKHYLRWYYHGNPVYEPVRYQQCTVKGCDNSPRSTINPLCEMHYYRQRRHGSPHTVMETRLQEVKYRAAHWRVQSDRGPASAHACVDCGLPAQHWSYDHCDREELMSDTGQPYSLKAHHYDARCAPCHATFDGTGRNQYTRSEPVTIALPRGANLLVGTTGSRKD